MNLHLLKQAGRYLIASVGPGRRRWREYANTFGGIREQLAEQLDRRVKVGNP